MATAEKIPMLKQARYNRITNRRRAFTLIELIVVIIIIAVVSSLTVPEYFKLHARAKFDRSTQSVIGILAYARDTAVQSGSDTIVRFDPSSETFTITLDQTDTGSDIPLALQQQSIDANVVIPPRMEGLGQDVGVTNFQVLQPTGQIPTTMPQQQSTPGEFRFHGDGSSDGVQFKLVSSDGYSANIAVAAATGKVSVKSEYEP